MNARRLRVQGVGRSHPPTHIEQRETTGPSIRHGHNAGGRQQTDAPELSNVIRPNWRGRGSPYHLTQSHSPRFATRTAIGRERQAHRPASRPRCDRRMRSPAASFPTTALHVTDVSVPSPLLTWDPKGGGPRPAVEIQDAGRKDSARQSSVVRTIDEDTP